MPELQRYQLQKARHRIDHRAACADCAAGKKKKPAKPRPSYDPLAAPANVSSPGQQSEAHQSGHPPGRPTDPDAEPWECNETVDKADAAVLDSPYLNPSAASIEDALAPSTSSEADGPAADDQVGDGMLDLVVIGAGPHALSLLCRLIDDEPDLMSEAERVHTMQKPKARSKPPSEIRKHLKKRYNGVTALPGCVVVDTHGEWLAEWKQNFAALCIKNTRSHSDLHPCPFDYRSLRVWAQTKHREDELKDMGLVDRDACRAVGFWGPFSLPSTGIFNDFCDDLVRRYGVAPMVRRGTVDDVRLVPGASGEPCTFAVRLTCGQLLTAKRVVSAVGPGPTFMGMRAKLPCWVDDLASEIAQSKSASESALRIIHSQELVGWLRQGNVPRPNARVLIVGGGQTAAHLSLLAAHHQCTATIVCRRKLTIKPFDLDLCVMGDSRAEVLAKLWKHQDPIDRVTFMKGLRGGGSVSNEVFQEFLKKAESPDDPHEAPCTLMEEVEVIEANWDSGGFIHVDFSDGSEGEFDLIWLATGGNLDLHCIPFLNSLMNQQSITTVSGLPLLQPDLSWGEQCPFYILGAFAQLELGPDALNMAGARSGSVRVAKALLQQKTEADPDFDSQLQEPYFAEEAV